MCRTNGWLLAIVAVFAVVGCESVNSRHILGERISDDLSGKLDGTWIAEDTVIAFHQVAPGEVRAAAAAWNDETAKFEVVEITLILSRLGEEGFINMVRMDAPGAEDDVEGTWYQYFRYELGENTLTIRGSSAEAFAKAVDAGALAGRVDIKRNPDGQVSERHVWIEGEKAALDAFVRDVGIEKLFGADSTTFRRLTDDDEQ